MTCQLGLLKKLCYWASRTCARVADGGIFRRPTIRGTVILIVGLLLLIGLDYLLNDPIDEVHYSLVISTIATYSVIIFALLISIIESGRSSGPKDMTRVLLWNSWIYPLSITEIFIGLSLPFGRFGLVSSLILVALGLGLIRSVYQVVNILISRSVFMKKRVSFLSDEFASFSSNIETKGEEALEAVQELTGGLMDEFEYYIHKQSTYFVDEYSALYKNLIEALLKKKEKKSCDSGNWRWLKQSLESLGAALAQSPNRDIIKKVFQLPIGIASDLALKYEDIELFQASISAFCKIHDSSVEYEPQNPALWCITVGSAESEVHGCLKKLVSSVEDKICQESIQCDSKVNDFNQQIFRSILKAYQEFIFIHRDRDRDARSFPNMLTEMPECFQRFVRHSAKFKDDYNTMLFGLSSCFGESYKEPSKVLSTLYRSSLKMIIDNNSKELENIYTASKEALHSGDVWDWRGWREKNVTADEVLKWLLQNYVVLLICFLSRDISRRKSIIDENKRTLAQEREEIKSILPSLSPLFKKLESLIDENTVKEAVKYLDEILDLIEA